jgi:hypothetical protein
MRADRSDTKRHPESAAPPARSAYGKIATPASAQSRGTHWTRSMSVFSVRLYFCFEARLAQIAGDTHCKI